MADVVRNPSPPNHSWDPIAACAAVAQLHSSDDGTPMPPPFTAMLYHMTAPVIKVENSYSIPDIHDWAFAVARSLRKDVNFAGDVVELGNIFDGCRRDTRHQRIFGTQDFVAALLEARVPFIMSDKILSLNFLELTSESIRHLLVINRLFDHEAVRIFMNVAAKLISVLKHTIPVCLHGDVDRTVRDAAVETLRRCYTCCCVGPYEMVHANALQVDDFRKLSMLALNTLDHISRSSDGAASFVGRVVLETEGGVAGIVCQSMPIPKLCNVFCLLLRCRVLDSDGKKQVVATLSQRGVMHVAEARCFHLDLMVLLIDDPSGQQLIIDHMDVFADRFEKALPPAAIQAVCNALNRCVMSGRTSDVDFIRRIITWSPQLTGQQAFREVLRDVGKCSRVNGVAIVTMLVTAHLHGAMNLTDTHRTFGNVAAEMVHQHKLMDQDPVQVAILMGAFEKDAALKKVLCRYL